MFVSFPAGWEGRKRMFFWFELSSWEGRGGEDSLVFLQTSQS